MFFRERDLSFVKNPRYNFVMREICYKCLRPAESCLCRFVEPFDCGVKFVFLTHPKEAKRQRTGTGRIARCALLHSETIVGVDFTLNDRLNALLSDERFFPALLYPASDALTPSSPHLKIALKAKKLLAVIIDSTWFCSKKILRLSENLAKLPSLSFDAPHRSIYTFKRQPRPECLSTLETCYYLIGELQSASVIKKSSSHECLMTAFKKLITFQLEKENERIEGKIPAAHATDYKYTRIKTVPAFE